MFPNIILFLLSITSIQSRIYQISSPGENGLMNFTSYLQGGEMECNTLLAEYSLTIINTTLIFNGNNIYSSYPYDMFLLIYPSPDDPKTTDKCLQYGGFNVFIEDCILVNTWPNTWKSHTPGTYYAVANFTSYNYLGSSWKVCIGNGYIQEPTPDPDDVYYHGLLDFSSSLITTSYVPTPEPTGIPTSIPSISFEPTGMPIVPTTPVPTISFQPTVSPTRRPTAIPTISFMPTNEPFLLQSTCNSYDESTLMVSFDTQLSGKQKVCSEFFASGILNLVNITLSFSGSTTKEFPYDMLLEIYLIDLGKGIQIGGFDLRLSDPNITYVGPWPQSWRSTASGTYYAIVNVSSYGLNGTGSYEICMMNGWKFGKRVSYEGLLVLPALYIDCPSWPPTYSPTRNPSQSISFSPSRIPSGFPTDVSSFLLLSAFH